MNANENSNSITGRDGYIVNQALLYAIAHIQSLPEEKQEWSNMRDMCAIVRADMAFFTIQLVCGVEHHTGIVPNLWPEPDEYLTEQERYERDSFCRTLHDWKRGMELMMSGKLESMSLNSDGSVLHVPHSQNVQEAAQ